MLGRCPLFLTHSCPAPAPCLHPLQVISVQHTIDRREVEAKRALPKEESPVSKDQQAAASGQVGARGGAGQGAESCVLCSLGRGHQGAGLLPSPSPGWLLRQHVLFSARLKNRTCTANPATAHQKDFCGRPGGVCG